MQLYNYSVNQSSEFCCHNPLKGTATSNTKGTCIFLYGLSPETFGYIFVYHSCTQLWRHFRKTSSEVSFLTAKRLSPAQFPIDVWSFEENLSPFGVWDKDKGGKHLNCFRAKN